MLDFVPSWPIMCARTASSNRAALHVISLATQWPEFMRPVLSGTSCIIYMNFEHRGLIVNYFFVWASFAVDVKNFTR
jgi:hypothetical protein